MQGKTQEMHGKECEGRFLGVKLGAYSPPGARQDRRDVDMEQDTACGNGRLERPARRIGSYKGRQATSKLPLKSNGQFGDGLPLPMTIHAVQQRLQHLVKTQLRYYDLDTI
ncbi:hypothetical protein WJX77_004653 [Trebouxia sp. C0004]